MPAQKRYYTVKEAARILGVSTNTIYSYLEDGTLAAKRIGKGRFKILASDLQPYLQTIPTIRTIQEQVLNTSSVDVPQIIIPPEEKINHDFIFWRIYLGCFLLAIGIIDIIWSKSSLLSIPLVISGVLTLLASGNWRRYPRFSNIIHYLDLAVIFLASYLSYITGDYLVLIFFVSTGVCLFIQSFIGVNKLTDEGSLVGQFVIMTVIGGLITGILAVIFPNLIPFGFVKDFIVSNKIAFLLMWYLFVLPSIYLGFLIQMAKKRSHLEYFLFPLYGLVALFGAAGFVNMRLWDSAYACFFYAFLTFVVVWLRLTRKVVSHYHYRGVLITFGWISAAILIGILSMFILREKLEDMALSNMSSSMDSTINDINDSFTISESSVSSVASQAQTGTILTSNDKQKITDLAQTIYERESNINRVLIYDSKGIAVGVYPRNSLTEGTDFSSREYFQIAKSTSKPYLSTVFESVISSNTVIYAVPVLINSNFVGEIGIAYNLESLSSKFQPSDSSVKIFAYDSTNNYVINTNSNQINQAVPNKIIANFDKGFYKGNISVIAYSTAGVPEWKVYSESSSDNIANIVYVVNIVIIVFFFVNAIQSLRAGFMLSEKGERGDV